MILKICKCGCKQKKIQPISASMCAACPEQKTKGQSNFAAQGRKTNKIMVASPCNILKNQINMSSLSQQKARKNKIMAACRKKTINLCGLSSCKKKSTRESGGESLRKRRKKSRRKQAKNCLPVHTAASRKQNKTTNLSPQAGETNNQPVRPVQMQ